MDFLNLGLTLYTLKREPAYVSSLPLRLYIEPTTRCNLKCRMCYLNISKRPPQDLSFGRFFKILEHFPFLQDLQLQGIGEPLLNPELFRMIEYAKSKRMRVGLFTNITLIDLDMAEKIVNSGLDWINLSLDGANAQMYEMVRRGANFEAVIQNIKNLMGITKRKKLKISIWFTAMRMNILELSGIISLAKKLGVEKVVAQGIHFWGNDSCRDYLKKESLLEDIELTRSVFSQAVKEAKRARIGFDFRPRYFQKRTKRICRWPWVSCFITVEGYVTPCCVQGSDPKIINFGNIFEKDFQNIWNSQQYQGFRRQLKSKYLPGICQDCPGYYYK